MGARGQCKACRCCDPRLQPLAAVPQAEAGVMFAKPDRLELLFFFNQLIRTKKTLMCEVSFACL